MHPVPPERGLLDEPASAMPRKAKMLPASAMVGAATPDQAKPELPSVGAGSTATPGAATATLPSAGAGTATPSAARLPLPRGIANGAGSSSRAGNGMLWWPAVV